MAQDFELVVSAHTSAVEIFEGKCSQAEQLMQQAQEEIRRSAVDVARKRSQDSQSTTKLLTSFCPLPLAIVVARGLFVRISMKAEAATGEDLAKHCFPGAVQAARL